MNKLYKKRVVLVSGANNPEGIGAAIAKKFYNEGHKVVLHGFADKQKLSKAIPEDPGLERYYALNGQPPETTAKQIGSDVLSFNCDLREERNIRELFAYAVKNCGHIDVLINNAAVGVPDSFLPGGSTHSLISDYELKSLSSKTIDSNFSINTKAAVLMMKEFVNQYIDNKLTSGSIINISTDSAYGGFPEEVSYQASKLALESYTRSAAAEIGPIGLKVNAIEPGPVQSGWIDKELEALCSNNIPLGKIGKPEDIANCALFLASGHAAWITGQVIKVNGGHRM